MKWSHRGFEQSKGPALLAAVCRVDLAGAAREQQGICSGRDPEER